MLIIQSKGYLKAITRPRDDNTGINVPHYPDGPSEQLFDEDNDSEKSVIKKWKNPRRNIEPLPEVSI